MPLAFPSLLFYKSADFSWHAVVVFIGRLFSVNSGEWSESAFHLINFGTLIAQKGHSGHQICMSVFRSDMIEHNI